MLIGLGWEQRDQSMLTFETTSVQGAAAITEKLTVRLPSKATRAGWPRGNETEILKQNPGLQSLPFQQVRHQIATFDAQPSSEGGIIVLVTGALLVSNYSKAKS